MDVVVVADRRIVAPPRHQLLLQLLLAQVLMSQLLKFIPDQVISWQKISTLVPPGDFGQDDCFLGMKLSRLPVTIRGARKSGERRAGMELATS